jgi:hypothetical protein
MANANRKVTPIKHDKAMKVAFDLIDEFQLNVKGLKEHLYEFLTEEHVREIALVVDPKANELENPTPWIELDHAIRAKLDDEGRKLFARYDDDWCQREYNRQIAAFYLGFAAGLRLGGSAQRHSEIA